MEPVVDGVHESDLAGERVEGADAATVDAAGAVGDFIMDVAGGEDGSLAIGTPVGIEASFDVPLAGVELLAYLGFHLKSLGSGVVAGSVVPQNCTICRGISSFSRFQAAKVA